MAESENDFDFMKFEIFDCFSKYMSPVEFLRNFFIGKYIFLSFGTHEIAVMC